MRKSILTIALYIVIQFTYAQFVNLDIKVFLEGAFNGTDMNTDLNNAGLIPLTQPYNTAPWNYEGTESVAAIPNSDVVDWILVELRETDGNTTTATEETIIARQAGFILNDGTITSTDGINPMQFSITVNYSLYAVIYHRNHLPIMSAEELLFDSGNYSWDFTIGEEQVFENINTIILESDNFNYSWGNWTYYSVLGSQVWRRDNAYGIGGTPCALMTGYESGIYYENDDWLISPPLDLESFTNEILTFQNAKNYTGNDLSLKISTNYSGTGLPYYADWTIIPFSMSPGTWEWTPSGDIDLSGFIGSDVYIAFHYTSTNTASATWEIDNIEITGTGYLYDEIGHKEIAPGIWGMMAGDGNASSKINLADKFDVWTLEAGRYGYLLGDYDLNGEVSNISKNDYWYTNFGRSSHVIMPWYCDMPFRDTRDDKVYKTVKIGNQCWMAENLNIGTTIPGATNMTDNGVLEKYCYEDNEANCLEYGGLYSWGEVMHYDTVPAVQGVCPEGWHVPTNDEFTLFINYLGGNDIAGGKLKDVGTIHWNPPNYGATNERGFTAYGTGHRHPDGLFYSLWINGYYATSTPEGNSTWVIGLYNNSDYISQFISEDLNYGGGVRCMKDAPPPTWDCGDELNDVDGNSYGTVQIGDQCWMAENLKATTYRNGTQIPNVTDGTEWSNLLTDAYVWYENDSTNWGNKYGALYNWFAVDDTNGLCPAGWHMPTNNEWTALTDGIGGAGSPHGNELKSCRQVNSPQGEGCDTTEHPRWNEHSTYYGTDDYGFLGLPGGSRGYNGTFFSIGVFGAWWSSTESSTTNTWYRNLNYSNDWVNEGSYDKQNGFSVRCLRD